MSDRVVLDASFVAAHLLEETHSAFVARTLRDLADRELTSTDLLVWEVGNILRTRRRASGLSQLSSDEALAAFEELEIGLAPPGDAECLGAIGRVADVHTLSFYDAGYLEMADRTQGVLATLDRKLAVAAIAAGLTVHSPFA